ncbi:MAG: methyltransferase domain-containing protein [Planctomycetes bacterium]|nr:methyltransferase domain-containing protein [Planctomycetota bacterium]
MPSTPQADPLIAPLRDNRFLIELIADIAGTPGDEVLKQFVREHYDLGVSVREELAQRGITPYVWSEPLEQFYAETNAFLYETIVWNRSPLKNDMRRWIGAYLRDQSPQPQRILTFGDGLGIDAYYLAELGHDVNYFDLSQKCTEFARRLFAHGNLEVNMIDDPAAVGEEVYDAVVCLDVLEHVPDPVSTVRWLAGRLRTGGKLLVHAPFYCVHQGVSTHLESNRRFSGQIKSLYERNGLCAVDGRAFWNPIVLEKQSEATETQSPRVPWQVSLGSVLLSFARYWSYPHIAVGKVLTNEGKLQAMVKELDANGGER